MRTALLLVILFLPLIVFGQNVEFVPLVDVPFIDADTPAEYANVRLSDYIQAFYMIAITVAAFLAVVKIIFGGVKYMVSDVITTKEEAKKDIRGALLGLLIVLAAVLILNTIWSGFTNFRIFEDSLTAIDYSGDTGFICSLYPRRAECQADQLAEFNPYINAVTFQAGDRRRSCSGLNATTCASQRCTDGTVVTTGLVTTGGSTVFPPGVPVCHVPGGGTGSGTPPPPPDDAQPINDNLYIDPNVRYSVDEQNNFVQQARSSGIYQSITPLGFGNDPGQASSLCVSQHGAGSQAYIIRREPPGETHYMCVRGS